jgi:hypothetical protein
MNKHQAFAAWAPVTSIWSVWAKPVLFAHMPATPVEDEILLLPVGTHALNPPPVSERTAIFLDLPGPAAVPIGLALAILGYRPVPLYNSVPGPSFAPAGAALDVMPICRALQIIAPQLNRLGIADDAPPVFLLDARRAIGNAPLLPGTFDNRSISLPTDFPSAAFLTAHDIHKVLLVQQSQTAPLEDLTHTLLRYQHAGIEIVAQTLIDPQPPARIKVARPSLFRSTLHRLIALAGLRRHPLGGFGGTLPEPSSG